jgi:hypothetical protein
VLKNMKKLGFSIYPNYTQLDDNLRYIDLADKYGFKRVFTCLMSAEEDKDKMLDDFKTIINHANDCGMEVIADVSPKVFKNLNADYRELGIFKEMGLYGIRLDFGFPALEVSIMTFNLENLKIELNMSTGTSFLDDIMSYDVKQDNLLGCHNFYPHRYTGLKYEHFIKCSKQFKKYNIRTAAFVSSKTAEFGPWPVSEGLCTLESHRELPIDAQAKHLFSTGLIDDVIIANAFASEEDFQSLSSVNLYIITLKAHLENGISSAERRIILEETHSNRSDISEYMIRSSLTRNKYKNVEIKPFNTRDIKRGDILIDNSLYKKYKGELQIALKDMKNYGKTNVVGKIAEEELFLLDYIKPWQKFKIEEH